MTVTKKDPLAAQEALENAAIQGWIAIGVRVEWASILGLPPDTNRSWRELLDATRTVVERRKASLE